MNTIKFDNKNTRVTAHRGLSGLERENTASAFVAAGNRNYYGIETDIYRTSDGHFVVNHDGRANRVEVDTVVKVFRQYVKSRLDQLVILGCDLIKGHLLFLPFSRRSPRIRFVLSVKSAKG